MPSRRALVQSPKAQGLTLGPFGFVQVPPWWKLGLLALFKSPRGGNLAFWLCSSPPVVETWPFGFVQVPPWWKLGLLALFKSPRGGNLAFWLCSSPPVVETGPFGFVQVPPQPPTHPPIHLPFHLTGYDIEDDRVPLEEDDTLPLIETIAEAADMRKGRRESPTHPPTQPIRVQQLIQTLLTHPPTHFQPQARTCTPSASPLSPPSPPFSSWSAATAGHKSKPLRVPSR